MSEQIIHEVEPGVTSRHEPGDRCDICDGRSAMTPTNEQMKLVHTIRLIHDKRDSCALGIVKDYKGNHIHISDCCAQTELLAAHDSEVAEREFDAGIRTACYELESIKHVRQEHPALDELRSALARRLAEVSERVRRETLEEAYRTARGSNALDRFEKHGARQLYWKGRSDAATEIRALASQPKT